MSALGTVLRAALLRRRVQSAVTALAATAAVTASVLGGSLLVASDAPFEHAFARQYGPHLTAEFDPAKTDAAALAATAHVPGVTAAAGPFRTVATDPAGLPDARPDAGPDARPDTRPDAGPALPAGMTLAPMTLAGRDTPGGPVDRVALTDGHWVTGPGQIVVSADWDGPRLPVGGTIAFPTADGGTTALRIVGLARSVTRTADGWIAPAQVDALAVKGTGLQELYRFADAATPDRLAADRAAVTATLPAGALTGATDWLGARAANSRGTGVFLPFLTAFGLLGIAMSVLIVGTVVAGTVGADVRRTGILKAIGFTPAQVVRVHLGQALLPAAAGTLAGALIGNLAATAVLSGTEQVYRTTSAVVAPQVDAAVVLGTLALVTGTALLCARRAGRMRTTDALAAGPPPRPARRAPARL
ncbi:ABC transporter permease, partial [Kitasatospora saccharophila]|uniref:ABC transporter permease n=1 Tax=Kitasatospora saccharophila TaxID=407973 RepID=UPI0031D3EFD0